MRLSICMPTYNFGRYIGEALDSIVPQMTSDVELIILDGASTDNTKEVVELYLQKQNCAIFYHRMPVRGGIDRDMELSVSYAQGEYIWLFSSDDVMKEGSIEAVLSEIRSGIDVYLCNYAMIELSVGNLIGNGQSLSNISNQVFNFSNDSERRQYFKKARNSEPCLSYMSSLVIRRQRWLAGNVESRFYGSCFAHAYRILSQFKTGLTIKILPGIYLYKRIGNDSFLDKGYVHRIGITVNGYLEMGKSLFGEGSYEVFQIKRLLRNEYRLRFFLNVKADLSEQKEKKQLKALFLSIYGNSGLIGVLKFFIFTLLDPKFARFLRRGYFFLRRSFCPKT